ncbi:hypothetical protein [Coraliomargarita akajimensis]|uniref:Cell division protein Smc n=1 Tax=Coraliomargarita akajimensis (strain DSM 45221 / IAM 15411 / JCM 23193 / KCTC 12865 / 04OKA010-24) TaxID=583355 RepID=D5EK42_CORAD|nr:hypothetical protein [Coraliomargarita akajimensis]ADE54791.1 cell division protein Smc [Coraliomargarita akajimensis DSM 45221]
MSTEEQSAIDKLLDPESTSAQLKSTLKWFAEYLEENHILNLPTSRSVRYALADFVDESNAPAALKTRAKNLIKKYKLG